MIWDLKKKNFFHILLPTKLGLLKSNQIVLRAASLAPGLFVSSPGPGPQLCLWPSPYQVNSFDSFTHQSGSHFLIYSTNIYKPLISELGMVLEKGNIVKWT